jgi:DUF1680 family protein
MQSAFDRTQSAKLNPFPHPLRFIAASGLLLALSSLSRGAPTLEIVDATQVRLLPGSPFFNRQELHRKGYLASLEADKLLFEFRKLAKLPQPAGVREGYAGWDSGFLRGHMAGHYLSAVSRTAAATGDSSFQKKADYMVAELAKCQTALNQNGYLSAFPVTAFDHLEGKPGNAEGIVVPYYTVHKILAGLLDAHQYAHSRQALEVAVKMANYFKKRLAALTPEQKEKIFRTDGQRNPQNEFGAMSDALAQLAAATGDRSYLEMAQIFNRGWFVEPLAKGEDRLDGVHANTHIAQALGLARCANMTGDATQTKASENFWKLVTGKHCFAIGGNSFNEWFGKAGVEAGPSVDAGKSLPATTAETCNTHNMLRLTSLLFAREPRAEYGDFFERALYNHILASMAPDTGAVTYFTPLGGNFRTYLNGTFCCVGTGIENAPRYNEGIYFQQAGAVWINLYIPSILAGKELRLRQEGNVVNGDPVHFIIESNGLKPETIHFRIPGWISAPAVLCVNGKEQARSTKPSSFLSVTRRWNAGDSITLSLPASLRLERAKDIPSMVSIFKGPVVLAGELGRDQMPNDFADKDAYLKLANATVPALRSVSSNPADWLQPISGQDLAYEAKAAGPAPGITFRPLYEVHHQRYSVYWQLEPVNKGENP